MITQLGIGSPKRKYGSLTGARFAISLPIHTRSLALDKHVRRQWLSFDLVRIPLVHIILEKLENGCLIVRIFLHF